MGDTQTDSTLDRLRELLVGALVARTHQLRRDSTTNTARITTMGVMSSMTTDTVKATSRRPKIRTMEEALYRPTKAIRNRTRIEDHPGREEEVGHHHQEGEGGQCMVVQCAVVSREEEEVDHHHQAPVEDIRHKAEGVARDCLIGMARRI